MALTSSQAAKRLGLPVTTLSTYLSTGKVPKPASVTSGRITIYLWTAAEIERVRKLLPKIKNGRKTRKRKQLTLSNQQLAKARPKTKTESKPKTKKKPPPSAAVPHKKKQRPKSRFLTAFRNDK
jgi:hypothetical protein